MTGSTRSKKVSPLDVAHELKNPLTSLQASAVEMFSRAKDADTQARGCCKSCAATSSASTV